MWSLNSPPSLQENLLHQLQVTSRTGAQARSPYSSARMFFKILNASEEWVKDTIFKKRKQELFPPHLHYGISWVWSSKCRAYLYHKLISLYLYLYTKTQDRCKEMISVVNPSDNICLRFLGKTTPWEVLILTSLIMSTLLIIRWQLSAMDQDLSSAHST